MPSQPGDVPITYADTTHARDLLGYQPQVAIEDGLARFVDWFLHGEWSTSTAEEALVAPGG